MIHIVELQTLVRSPTKTHVFPSSDPAFRLDNVLSRFAPRGKEELFISHWFELYSKTLRLQRERMQGSHVPSTREYFRYFGLDAEKLKAAKEDALVMHPGPMNRGVEIASEIADGPQSVIQEQVEMGVAVRMAVMEALLDTRRNREGDA